MLALAKDDGNDEDMAEMISFEVDSLSRQLAELEEKLKVFISNPYYVAACDLCFNLQCLEK